MTTDTDIIGAVCVDCTMAIANADTSGISDIDTWLAGVTATDATDGGRYIVALACDDDCEGYFSWSACDYCGSKLGGDRHPVVFFPAR